MQSTPNPAQAAPRVVVAGMAGDAGKTTVALGLARTLRDQGLGVQPFKKGPDFIDAAWLTHAAGTQARNLDTFLLGAEVTRRVFSRHAPEHGVSLIEGNRGLFDGADALGTHSTAALARLLRAPVILVVNVAKVTRSAAAYVLGCQRLEPGVEIAGVVLNRVSGERHRRLVVAAIEQETGVPVIGALPRLDPAPVVNRHLGLCTPEEHVQALAAVQELARVVRGHTDIERVLAIAHQAPALERLDAERYAGASHPGDRPVRIGVLRDSAFTFYYPENLEALEREGAELAMVSPLRDQRLANVSALYVGGGFPETHGQVLSGNRGLLGHIREAAAKGLPVYAECGGLMYVARALHVGERTFEMAGLLPVETVMTDRPVGHGYVEGRVVGVNPFYDVGESVVGHMFHYSTVRGEVNASTLVLELQRGHGMVGQREGIARGSVFGTYVHVHALSQPSWARGLIRAARVYQQQCDSARGSSSP